ncbi:MAG: DNA recombination protein RmuC [Rickettsiales bacterium]|jgi:DNA recombination protein RmuC|nr:DNA recombination protein RmuC [Rickettsiales bacterium]
MPSQEGFWILTTAGAFFALGWMVVWFRLTVIRERLRGLVIELQQTRQELLSTQQSMTEYHERAIMAETELRALSDNKNNMKLEFKSTATQLFEEMNQKFTQSSEKKIGDLLLPLRDRLGEFQKKIDDSFSQQGKEQHTLKAEIEKIVLQTDSLTKALRGDVKAQGNWGEVMLEKILEESGLRRGVDYTPQAIDLSLRAADGSLQKPDIIVHLPDGKHVIIDSKVSLTAYDRYCDKQEDNHLYDFLKSLRAHVVGLSAKKYQTNEKLESPDFVFMFMPIEGAYALAVQQDRELHSFAWDKKVVLVCPSTLFASLRTIASLWRIDQQNRYALQIADEGGKMYDRLVEFCESLQNIGKRISATQSSYDEALMRLSEGRGNVISRAEKMKLLGAKASKSIPKELLEDNERSEGRVIPIHAEES